MFLLSVCSSCSNSQDTLVANYRVDATTTSGIEAVKSSILKANEVFKAYSSKEPVGISLFLIDSVAHLKNEEITELKSGPEAFLMLPPEELTSEDTLRIIEEFKTGLDGTTLVIFDSLGNVIRHITGLQKLNIGEKTTVSSEPTSPAKPQGAKTRMDKFKDLNDADVLQLVMKSYNTQNKVIDPEARYRYFLWLNFFYEYFEVNKPYPGGQYPRWLVDFAVVDASEPALPKGFSFEGRRPISLATIFTKMQYGAGFQFRTSGVFNLFVPSMDDEYSGKWKYLILNFTNQFTVEDDSFLKMTLVVEFLKEKYGKEVIKDLSKWYLKGDDQLLLITSFLKEKYDVTTNISEMNEGFSTWVLSRKN